MLNCESPGFSRGECQRKRLEERLGGKTKITLV